MQNNLLYEDITKTIIKSAFRVHNILGCGLLEKIYEKALFKEMQTQGLQCEAQKPFLVHYENKLMGQYFADMVVNNKIIVEIKTVEKFSQHHFHQIINYLKISELKVGILFNFQHPRVIFKRFVV